MIMRWSGVRGILAVIAAAGLIRPAGAQLVPDRTYYGVDRAMPMTVTVRAGAGTAASIELLEPVTAKVVAKAELPPVDREDASDAGAESTRERGSTTIDLSAMFPSLWRDESPRLLYAQLVAGGRKVGPATVLQPMLTPVYAARVDRSGEPMFAESQARVYSGIRAYVDKHVVLETTAGQIAIRLRPDVAPNTCWNFRELVAGGLFTEVIVHRVASLGGRREPDIIQTGDPNGTGRGGPGYAIDLEPSSLPNDFGVVSAARVSDPNSAGSQFFIALNREGTAYLDNRYTAFAEVVSGADAVRSISATPVGPDNRPTDPPVIRSARLVDAPPYGDGPAPAKDPAKKEGGR